MSDDTAAALSLLNAAAVRTRAKRMLALGLDDKLPHFRVDLAQLPKAVDLVLEITRKNYPALDVPFHSRWRHFEAGGHDRWTALAPRLKALPKDEVLPEAMRVALHLATGPQLAIRLTKRALNGWIRNAGPIFDQSAAYEMLTFMGEDIKEGLASLREKRAPRFG